MWYTSFGFVNNILKGGTNVNYPRLKPWACKASKFIRRLTYDWAIDNALPKNRAIAGARNGEFTMLCGVSSLKAKATSFERTAGENKIPSWGI